MTTRFTVSSAAVFMHAVLLSVAMSVMAAELTLGSGVVAAATSAFFGALLAERLSQSRYRTQAVLGLGGLIVLVGLTLTEWLLGSVQLATALGPTIAMGLGEVFRWGALGLGGAVVLRTVALRFRAALAIEGSIAVLIVASTVAAHRDGMIARPLELSDWFWRQGIDPVLAFLAVGLAAALLLAGVLAYGRSARRTFVQLGLVLALGMALVAFVHDSPPDEEQRSATGAALNKKKDGKRDGRSGAGKGSTGTGQSKDAPADNNLPPPPQQGGQSRPSAVVIFHRDVKPFGETFYFRHAAFSQFNGTRLVESTMAARDPDARYVRSGRQDISGAHTRAKLRALVATDVAVLSAHSRTFALIDAVQIEPRPNPEPARFRRAYRVVSMVPTATVGLDAFLGQEAGERDWSAALWRHYTEIPADERYHDLARRLQSRLRAEFKSDPMVLALTVKRYLEENTIYSFKNRYEGDDPTGLFLFSEDKRGYCVHLAHSAAYLLRALGVPTRVSAGYAVAAKNLGRGSALLIKDGDAHAWAEIYIRGEGWIPIEVTPEETDIEPAPFEEADLQQLLGEMARKQGRFERAVSGPSRWVQWGKAAFAQSPWVLVFLVILAYTIKVWRGLRAVVGSDPGEGRLQLRAAYDALSAAGWVRHSGESRERFAARIAQPHFESLTQARVATVMGSRREPTSLVALRLMLRSVRTHAKQSVPAWRYWLGVLNPVSWMWSK